jgi:DNA segregation ATPase FtsK/SpoIIIE-like protein
MKLDNTAESIQETLLKAAKCVVISEQRASIALIQRHLRIAYKCATKLMRKLEAAGVVNYFNSPGAPEVALPYKKDNLRDRLH